MSAAPWFRWFPADYRRKTLHLSFIEDAAYRRMIEAYMETRGPLPANSAALYRLCSAQDDFERAAIDRISREFFKNGDGKLKHARCDQEIANQEKQAKQRVMSASHASRIRWASGAVSGKMRDSDSDSDSNAVSEPEKPKSKSGVPRATRLSPDWRLPDDWQNWACKVHHLPPDKVIRISLSFRDYWVSVPGRKGVKLDWLATWRNWIRKEVGDD